jgi:hypothetical protein
MKGGFKGTISDYNPFQSTPNTEFNGEIYPWYVSKNTKDMVIYDVTVELLNNENIVTFIKEFHNFKINDQITIFCNGTFVNYTILKIISSQKIIIDNPFDSNLLYNIIIYIFKYVGTRLDGTKTPNNIIDKDRDYFNATDKINHLRETVTNGYIACQVPPPSNNLLKFNIKMLNPLKPEDGAIIYLVRSDTEQLVTYGECSNILGFTRVGKEPIPNLNDYVMYQLAMNLDGQNHIHKGSFGIRMDQIDSCAVINCNISEMESNGFAQEVNLIGNQNLMNNLDIIQPLRPGTHVNDVHGVSINGCENVLLKGINTSLMSSIGNIYGIETYGNSNNVEINNIVCNTLDAGFIYGNLPMTDPFKLSNRVYYNSTFPPQDSVGIHISETTTNVILDLATITGTNISSPAVDRAELIRYEKN